MPQPLLYQSLAHLWPRLSPPSDYEREAATLRELLATLQIPGDRRPRLLELGVGGGHTLSHLAADVDAVGVDLSAPMLEGCRRLVPSCRLVEADLRDVRLGSRFDAVLLHDAADYLLSSDDIARAAETLAHHVEPSGLVVVAPTYVSETFASHEVEVDQNDDGRDCLTFLSYVHDPDPADTEFEMLLVYLLNEAGKLRVVEDRHRCGLFPSDTWLKALEEQGFSVEVRTEDFWTLFVGRPRHSVTTDARDRG